MDDHHNGLETHTVGDCFQYFFLKTVEGGHLKSSGSIWFQITVEPKSFSWLLCHILFYRYSFVKRQYYFFLIFWPKWITKFVKMAQNARLIVLLKHFLPQNGSQRENGSHVEKAGHIMWPWVIAFSFFVKLILLKRMLVVAKTLTHTSLCQSPAIVVMKWKNVYAKVLKKMQKKSNNCFWQKDAQMHCLEAYLILEQAKKIKGTFWSCFSKIY